MAIDSLITWCTKGRFKMVSFGRVCRSIWNHPFIVAILLFLVCLHQYFPWLFYLLLSASPIFVCTAVLLGALLVHGQPNNHKVECCGEMSNTITSPKTGPPEHTSSINKESISPKYRFAEVRKDIVEKGWKASGLVGVGSRVVNDHIEEIDRESCDTKFNRPSKTHEKKSKSGFHLGDARDRDVLMAKISCPNQAEKCDSKRLQVPNDIGMQQNRLDFSLNQHKHEEDGVDHDSIDYESDTGDKSSLDALISHVILTPQETLPLLDSDEPQLTNHSHDVSPKSELQSLDSNQSSSDSDEENDYKDKQVENENDGDADEDETPNDKKGSEKSTISWTEDDKKILLEIRSSEMEKTKHLEHLVAKLKDKRGKQQRKQEEEEEAIGASEDDDDDDDDENLDKGKGESQQVTIWTEEDEKNLRYVGNSELERNQRLENLLATRRAQRNFSMISQRNFIDLDRSKLPVQVAPISTSRVNPFDVFNNTNLDPDVPSIPGSAPSVPRKNPFDSPCTSPRGTHNLNEISFKESMDVNLNNPSCETNPSVLQYDPMGNMLKPNFVDTNQKEVVFRRYESFNPGYNFMEETSTQNFVEFDQKGKETTTFSRHQSFSATRPHFPSTFTLQNPNNVYLKPVFVPEQEATNEVQHPSSEKQSSHDSDSTISSESDVESSHASKAHEDGESAIETDVASKLDRDNESIVTPDHESIHSDNKSESSSKVINSPKNDQDEHLTTTLDEKEENVNQTIEARANEKHNTTSSSSASSEEDDGSSNTCKDEGEKINEPDVSLKASQDVVDVSHTIPEEGNNHAEPVYDTSPSSVEKNIPFSLAATEI